MHPSSLLVAVSELFEPLWERAVPFNQPASADQDATLTDRDRDLLGLLAAES